MAVKLARWISFLLIFAVPAMACSFFTPGPSATQTSPPRGATATRAPGETAVPGPTSDGPEPQSIGPKIVTGQVSYTNAFFTEGVAQPVIILEDQTGFVRRDRNFVFPSESQVIGQITSDFFTSPFNYSLALPAEPNGTLNDVDHDGQTDAGVMVFAVAYWTNTWGDPFLERRDQGGGGWSSAYASTKVSDDRDTYLEVYGGKVLVYAPDAQQEFPAGFGADEKLFTDDDALMALPAGWSVVDLDQSPFAIDRSEQPVIDLLEPEGSALDDFSGLSYTEAFDRMLEKFTNEYAFTELKQIDWAAKGAEFRPRFEQASDPHAYALALRDFIWSIPDAHVGFDQSLLDNDFLTDTAGGVGFAMRETDDGAIIANFILPGGPAEGAGMVWGAEILSLDGRPAGEAVSAARPWSGPFSNPVTTRLQQLRYALRFPLEKGEVAITFRNPGGEEQSAALAVIEERDSFFFSSFSAGGSATALPVEFDVLPSGNGYVKINSFLDNDVLSIQVWERALQFFNQNQVPGVIIDMRLNGGGSGWLADQMAAYFFEEETVTGNTAFFDDASGEFYMDPGDEDSMIPPRPELQYLGPVAVLIGPGCASACEFFAYNMTINGRAMIVGQYPTDGAGGSVEQFLMPEFLTVQLTIGRAVGAEGQIHIEGTGVVPTLDVPVTLDNLQRQANGEDVVLAAAEAAVGEPIGAGVAPSGPPAIASASDAEAAFNAGTPRLEDVSRDAPDASAFTQPGTVTYAVQLNNSEALIWMYAWCAADAATLQQNFDNMSITFVLAGADVSSQVVTTDVESDGQPCRLVYTALDQWPAGEHHLTTTATFLAEINDGISVYPAGDYIVDYTVFVAR
jgi:C-terminal processing protease CtpA/Prc